MTRDTGKQLERGVTDDPQTTTLRGTQHEHALNLISHSKVVDGPPRRRPSDSPRPTTMRKRRHDDFFEKPSKYATIGRPLDITVGPWAVTLMELRNFDVGENSEPMAQDRGRGDGGAHVAG